VSLSKNYENPKLAWKKVDKCEDLHIILQTERSSWTGEQRGDQGSIHVGVQKMEVVHTSKGQCLKGAKERLRMKPAA
jgi:hypothetical protein